MFGITVPAITSAARTVVGYATVYLVAKGYIVGDEAELISTAVVAIVGVAASIFFRRKSALVTQAADLTGVTVAVSKSAAPALASATAGEPGVKATA